MEDTTTLEKLFAQNGSLRSHIPRLLEHKLFYNRLKKLSEDWQIFKDVLQGIEIAIADIFDIFHILQTSPKIEVEVQEAKGKNKNPKESFVL